MTVLRILALSVCLAAPASADGLKASEILTHISGDWDYVAAPGFKPGRDFCNSRKSRFRVENGRTLVYLSIRADKPENYFSETVSAIVGAEPDALVTSFDPGDGSVVRSRYWMRSEDFIVAEVKNPNSTATMYFKRCPVGERIS